MCGPTGVGKSHLANAIAIEALKRNFHVLAKSDAEPKLPLFVTEFNRHVKVLRKRCIIDCASYFWSHYDLLSK
jgi:chromosomal replication initiation ATPase DnaA